MKRPLRSFILFAVFQTNRKLDVLHPGVCEPWQPNTLICIPFHPVSEVLMVRAHVFPGEGGTYFTMQPANGLK